MFVPSRRKLLARGVSLGAVLATSSWSLTQSSFANPLGKPIGIQTWTVNDTLKHDPADTLNKLGKIGFAEVEAASLVGLKPQAFRRLLDDAGLRCPSAHLQFDMDNLGKSFDEAHALGATYATASSLIEPVGKAMGAKLEWRSAMSREEAKRTVDVANRIAEAARRAGLQFTLHNHDREFVDLGNGEVGYDIIWRDTEARLVQFEIDCGWMIFAGRNPVDYFKKYPGRVPLIHVKDFQPKKNNTGAPMSEEMQGSELGRGTVDYKPILKAAKAAGLKHYFAEQEGPFSRMSQLEAARVAYDYLHSIT